MIQFERVKKPHASGLAQLHGDAFPDFFMSSLGPRMLEQFYLAHSNTPDAITSVAIEDGAILGVAVGTLRPGGYYRRIIAQRLPSIALAGISTLLRQPTIAIRLWRRLFASDMGPPPAGPNDALLSSICTNPNTRASGLGSLLLQNWEDQAKSQGARRAHLITDAHHNARVNEFYVRNGWLLNKRYETSEGRTMNRYVRIFEGDHTPLPPTPSQGTD